MPNLNDLVDITPVMVWDGVIARRVQGENLTLAIVELEPGSIVPEHRHPSEQFGMVIQGRVTFRIADEERVLGPGGTWRILSDVPHSVEPGPRGAVVIDVFSPARHDWDEKPAVGSPGDPAIPVWPSED